VSFRTMAEFDYIEDVTETSREKETNRTSKETESSKEQTSQISRGSKEIEISIPDTSRLDGVLNYQVWAFRLQSILDRNNVWRFCATPPTRSDLMGDNEMEGRKIALQAITNSVKDSVVPIVRRFEDPYSLWTTLINRYQSKSGSRCLMLLCKLVGLRKEENTSMEQYLTEVNDTMDQLEGMGVSIPEDLYILLLLNSLPHDYQLFSRTQTGRDELLSFLELEA
jgi:hypothetical protein